MNHLEKINYLSKRKAFIKSCLSLGLHDAIDFEVKDDGVEAFRTELNRRAENLKFSVYKTDIENRQGFITYSVLRVK